MKKYIYYISILFITLIGFYGCSTVQLPPPPKPAPFNYLNILLTRTSATGTEFEQFKLGEEGDLFVECGKIRGGRYYAELQKFGIIPEVALKDMQTQFLQFLTLGTFRTTKFDKAGNNSSLFDPGKFTVKFKTPNEKHEISTTLDSISTPQGSSQKLLKKLAITLRSASRTVTQGAALCNNSNFFGIAG